MLLTIDTVTNDDELLVVTKLSGVFPSGSLSFANKLKVAVLLQTKFPVSVTATGG